MKIKKLKISEKIETLDIYSLEGDVDDLIAKLTRFKLNLKYDKVCIDVRHSYDIDDDGYYSIDVYGYRLESDEEFNARKAAENEVHKTLREQKKFEKNLKEEKERKEFERLKAKFEKQKT